MTALEQYNTFTEGETIDDPIERLRFFLSLALIGEDWLDVEPFIDDVSNQLSAAHARIDELMLEYCPNEMTIEQLDNYAAHQRPVSESELPEAIRARGDMK